MFSTGFFYDELFALISNMILNKIMLHSGNHLCYLHQTQIQ